MAIDGSKFKAVKSRDDILTMRKISGRLMRLEADISRYVDEVVRIDREEVGETRAANVANFATRYGRIQQELTRLKDIDTALADTPDRCTGYGQISRTDPRHDNQRPQEGPRRLPRPERGRYRNPPERRAAANRIMTEVFGSKRIEEECGQSVVAVLNRGTVTL